MVPADTGHNESPPLDQLPALQSGQLHDVFAPSGGDVRTKTALVVCMVIQSFGISIVRHSMLAGVEEDDS